MRYQCPNCRNSTLRFTEDINAKNLVCEYCHITWIAFAEEYLEHP